MIISLIGYRGCGKSSVAALLADRLGCESVDVDAEIVKIAGKTIAEIFAEEGEPTFRKLEAETIQKILQQDDLILATGGGAVMNPQTCQLLQSTGPVVWLQATVEVITERLTGDAGTTENRPHLTATGGVAEIEQLLVEREPLYRGCASMSVDTSSKSIEDVVAEITMLLPSDFLIRTPPAGDASA